MSQHNETDIADLLCSMNQAHAHAGTQIWHLSERVEALQVEASRGRVKLGREAQVLACFYREPLSMSSVQPVLALAEELNPTLRTQLRGDEGSR